MHVSIGSHYVQRQSNHEQAGRPDMRSLKVPMARPKPRTECSARRQGEKEQCEERRNTGEFVTRGGRLYVLDHVVIDPEQQADVQNCGCERQPAEELVSTHTERAGGASSRANRQDAQDEAGGDRAETQYLRNLPRYSEAANSG